MWKFYRGTAKISGNNTLNWGDNMNISNSGNESCSLADLNMCNANFAGSIFARIGVTESLAFNMYTREFKITTYTYDAYNLPESINWDLRSQYYGNVFRWKGVNHRYTYGSGDNYYLGTMPGDTGGGSSGAQDANNWRATFLR